MKTKDKLLDLEFYSDFFFEKDCPICTLKANEKPNQKHDPFICLKWYLVLEILCENEKEGMSLDVVKSHVERKFEMIIVQMKEYAKESIGMKGHSTEEIIKKFKKEK